MSTGLAYRLDWQLFLLEVGEPGTDPLALCLEVDAPAEPGIQLNLQLSHLLAYRTERVFQLCDILLNFGSCYPKHLLGLGKRDVEECISNFVSAPRVRDGLGLARPQGDSRYYIVLIGKLELERDIVYLLLFLL